MNNRKLLFATTAIAMIFTLSTGYADLGKGDGAGNGHAHGDLGAAIDDLNTAINDLQDQIDTIGDLGSCTPYLEQMPFAPELVIDDTYPSGSNTLQEINSCPVPYTRTGAVCLASRTSDGGFLQQAGTNYINDGSILACRGSLAAALDDGTVRLISYPICTKVDLVCDGT